jgi:hypothetical protein
VGSDVNVAAMDLSLRLVAAHPNGGGEGGAPTEFALSGRKPAVLLGRGALLVEQSTSTLAVRASLRASADVERLVYCGGPAAYLAFLESHTIAAFAEQREGGIELAGSVPIPGDERPVSFAAGSRAANFAVFTKADSPSVYHVRVEEGGARMAITKLRGDITGQQTNVSAMDGGIAKLRGKVATSAKSRVCPVVALDAHPNKFFAAAAYENGILRVWDVAHKELRSQFDAQLLLRETIVDIALHPSNDVLLACTSQGRVMVFQIKGMSFGKAEQPEVAKSKLRDRSRRFRAMCFMEGSPAYLLLLTTSRRIIVRLVDEKFQLVASTRYTKASKTLATERNGAGSTSSNSTLNPEHRVSIVCEPQFGIIASTLDISGNVFVYQTMVDQMSGVRRAVVGAPLDTGFSAVPGKAFKGPVHMFQDGLFAQNGKLYSYALNSAHVTQLCHLPPLSEVRRIEAARDQYGDLLAAIVFLYVDGKVDANAMYELETSTSQYVIANRRDGEAWNVSTPVEGATGCFLNKSGRHDRFLIMSADGMSVSVRSFDGQRYTKEQKQNSLLVGGEGAGTMSRGVQRFRVGGKGASQVFRAPFSAWCAVVYEDNAHRRLTVSNNSFRVTPAFSDIASEGESADDLFRMDEETVMSLKGRERVVDIRWQRLPTGSQSGEQYLGAVMTTERIYIIRDVFEQLAMFDFSSIDRNVIPFTVPTMCWVGPAVMVMFGQFMYAVTLDGQSDLVAGISQGENACALVAAMPDGIVFVRPPPPSVRSSSASASSPDTKLPVSVASRPIGMMSVLVRGMLALPSARNNDGSYYIEKLKDILLAHDTSQGSEALIDALIRNNLAPIAYILATSESGKHSLPPLQRAAFLGRIGDLRGALAAAEAEYTRLPSSDSFHNGTELFRLLQRILNMAMGTGDFAVGRRCSELLGRKGTFSAFVDGEGGLAALTSLSKYAAESGKPGIAQALGTLLDKSSKSCIANDSSAMPSTAQMQQTRAGIQSYNRNAIDLGAFDQTEVFITVAPQEAKSGIFDKPQTVQIPPMLPGRFVERLEMMQRDECIALKGQFSMDVDAFYPDDPALNITMNQRDREVMDESTIALAPLGGGDGRVGTGLSGGDRVLFGVGGGRAGGLHPQQLPGAMVPGSRYSAQLLGGNGAQIQPQDMYDVRHDAAEYAVMLRDAAAEAQAHARAMAVTTKQTIGDHDAVQASQNALHMAAAQSKHIIRTEARQMPDQLAVGRLEAAFRKMQSRRNASALREVQHALVSLGRAISKEEIDLTPERRRLVSELVYYLVALEILNAIDTLAQSPQARSLPGKMTIAQYAMALTSLPLRDMHRISAILLAVDANMAIEAYGRAAAGMSILKDLGVPPEMRIELRAKYALCTSRGLMDATPPPNTRLCWHTLRLIAPGSEVLRCDFCPASFSVLGLNDEGVSRNQRCVCCHIGRMVPQ